jgi:hypothetical protein
MSETTKRLLEASKTILGAESPMTVRQLFYRLVSAEVIANCRGDYQKVSRVMTRARNLDLISWDAIVDRSRPVYQACTWLNLAERFEHVARTYRRDAWQDQPVYVEVWSEKDAVVGSIQEVTERYAVTLRPTRGFSSTTNVHELAELFINIGKPVFVFYIGDHDPSGRCMDSEIVKRVRSYGAEFTLTRLAIHRADIRKFKLPPLQIKPADSRADAFERKYGTKCVELDALPPAELRRRIEAAIRGRLDPGAWQRAMLNEQAASIGSCSSNLKRSRSLGDCVMYGNLTLIS